MSSIRLADGGNTCLCLAKKTPYRPQLSNLFENIAHPSLIEGSVSFRINAFSESSFSFSLRQFFNTIEFVIISNPSTFFGIFKISKFVLSNFFILIRYCDIFLNGRHEEKRPDMNDNRSDEQNQEIDAERKTLRTFLDPGIICCAPLNRI